MGRGVRRAPSRAARCGGCMAGRSGSAASSRLTVQLRADRVEVPSSWGRHVSCRMGCLPGRGSGEGFSGEGVPRRASSAAFWIAAASGEFSCEESGCNPTCLLEFNKVGYSARSVALGFGLRAERGLGRLRVSLGAACAKRRSCFGLDGRFARSLGAAGSFEGSRLPPLAGRCDARDGRVFARGSLAAAAPRRSQKRCVSIARLNRVP